MDIGFTLRKAVAAFPDNIAVVDGARSFTWREVDGRVRGLSASLARAGIRPGDRLAVLDDNSHAFLETYYAAAALGAILCPINTRLAGREVAAVLVDAGARCLVARARFAPLVREVHAAWPLDLVLWAGGLPDAADSTHALDYERAAAAGGDFAPVVSRGDAVAHLYYTSGTTGRPKGVMLTHDNVCCHALGAIAELDLRPTDVWGHFAPMFHLADAWATFAITWVGGRHVMLERFEPEAAMDAMTDHGVTLTNLIPTMLNLMVNHPGAAHRDFSRLRLVLSGGAPIAPDLVRRVMDTFRADYVQTYGMTETSPYLTLSLLTPKLAALPDEERFAYKAKTGRPFVAVDLRVVDDLGREVPADGRTVGEIWVRGDTVTPGYWNRPEETALAFSDGWLKTGDLAVMDAEGYVDIVDRKKDMIITGGENVYSTEVEHVLYEHPSVLEAAVFGVPDERWGEAVTAAVVLRPGEEATEEDIIAFARERLARYKAPKSIRFLAELPKTGTGKISKKALREASGDG